MPRLRCTALFLTATLLVALVSMATVPAGASQTAKKGDPVTIMTIGEFEVAAAGSHNPEVSGAVQARAKAINKAGGLKDATGTLHKLQVVVCNTNNDPNLAAQCARDAVDKHVAAVVGAFSTLSTEIYPVLEAANIPSIGQTPSEPTPFVSPVSFTTQSGIPGIFFDMPHYLAAEGAKKLSLVVPDLPAAAQEVPLVKLAAQAAGADVVNSVSVPLDAADLSPQVAAATANGADGIMAVVIGDQTGRFIRGLSQAGYKGKLATASAFLTPALLDELKGEIDGTLLVLNYPPASAKSVPGIRQFNKDMNAFNKSLSKSDSAVNDWLATYVFEQTAKKVDAITGPNMLAALKSATSVDTLGLTPPLNFTAPVHVATLPLPRIFNPMVVEAVVKKGNVVSASIPPKFVNGFAP
jgi:ABC-type branched-subunit amino acid transport system substrate-binding protein